MAFSYACLTLQRVVIPVSLVLAALFRPVGISFVYLLMFFISPFIPIATARNFKSSVTPYLIILIALSTILLLCHIALQVTILALQPDSLFGTCAFTEQLLRHVGFIDYRNIRAVAFIEWLAPEVLIFFTSLSVYLVTKKLTTIVTPEENAVENGEGLADYDDDNAAESETIQPAQTTSKSKISIPDDPNFDSLIRISPLFCLATLFFAAVLRPSVPGGFYLLIFLLSGSYWATFQTLQRGFALLLRFVMVVLVVHIICIVSYQTPWMQQNVDSHTLVSRLIGLEPLVTSSCANDIRIITFDTNYKLDSFLSPIVILFSYYALALTTKNLIKPRIVTKPTTAFGQQLENGSNKFQRQLSLMTQTARVGKKDSWTKTQRLNVSIRREQRANAIEPTETTPLVRHTTRKQIRSGSNPDQNTTGNSNSDIALDVLQENHSHDEDTGTSIFDQISYGIVSVGGFIYQNSYIFTNILMMAWSIVYHSWLTFVLLLWANVLWMIPNQRKAMMRSSPFIVIYAELLIIAQYIYGMDLTNDELPSKVDTTGINLAQIGLERPQEEGMQPCVPLIVKTSFLLMFWVTLRQFVREKNDKRRSTMADMIGPLQLTFGTTTTDLGPGDSKKTSKFLKKAGAIIKNLLVRLWIWLLVLVIFLCAITGKQMTGFRICYMALFLFFLLVFQSSSKAWLNIMYGFWLFLIFYAMSILILVYTYQFDKFDQYWTFYLNISKTLQSDIGLERFKTKDLFLHLVSPTIIVILTVIQVHYFHKRFIDSLQQPTLVPGKRKTSFGRQSSAIFPIADLGLGDVTDFEKSIKDLIRMTIKKLMQQSKRIFKNMKNVFWRLLELHVIKFVYIAAFVCSVHVVCVLHVAFVGICVMGTMSRSKIKIFLSRIISFIVSVLILAKMIYQVTYLDHAKYKIECKNLNASHEYNTAVWFGLQKATDETEGLMGLLKPYIIYMVMVTLHAVVTLRQYQMRTMHGTNNDPLPKVLFPTIVRADAEKNFVGMLKYLFNYGFYKFGFEISLITLAATITFRQDIVAIFYVGWLFVLLTFDRSKSRRVWSIFQIFIAVSIICQYLLFVGLPPTLCMEYPWEKLVFNESIQFWALLPGSLNINHVHKLVFDYILLMMVNRQKKVFNIEASYEKNDNYAGGSNKSVIHDIANLGHVSFINPTRDFLSHVRNYLDVFLNGVLCGFYWVTLAVVFLAGTNIADLLALGYLIGAFVFLWQGSDFYLRPIHIILNRWKWMIFYNVSNIVIKTCLQMAGCLFMHELTTNCCWLVHMLGISCASRSIVSETFEMEEEQQMTNDCPATRTQVILVWDTICFAFLLFQLRIFKSHYFCHIINDTKANTILASRGADIIEDLRQKQIEHRQEHEQEVLYKIKRKMEKIRATQQKMLRPIDKPTHFDELAKQQIVEKHLAPLAQQNSFSSCQGSGYHTPNDDDSEGSSDTDECISTHSLGSDSGSDSSSAHAQLLDNVVIQCDGGSNEYANVNSLSELNTPAVIIEGASPASSELLPYASNQLALQPHTPSSDLMTMPLDGFLDVKRLSLYSAPNSDLLPPTLPEDSEESYAVFSPPPYEACQPPMQHLLAPTNCSLNVNVSGGSSVISSTLNTNGMGNQRHRRQSSVNAAVSWNETVSIKCTPKNFVEHNDVSVDIPVTLRKKSLHRRHLSMGNASYSMDESTTLQNDKRRRYSNLSEYGYPIPGSRLQKRKEIKLHPQAVRAGDYYMFEDMDEKFELDLIEDEVDFLDDKITGTDKMTRRKTLIDVWKDIHTADYRRKLYVRQRSYASAPGSRIGIKIDEELNVEGDSAGIRTSTYSEPIECVRRSKSEPFEPEKLKTKGASTSKQAAKIAKAGKRDSAATVYTEKPTEINSEKDLVKVAIFTQPEIIKEKIAPIITSSEVIAQKTHAESTDAADFPEDDIKYAGEIQPDEIRFAPVIEAEEVESDAEQKLKVTETSVKKKPKPDIDTADAAEKATDKSKEDGSDSDEDMQANPIVRLLEAFLVSLIIRLNRFSRHYRYVNKILKEEKKVLKQSRGFLRLKRSGAAVFSLMKKRLSIESENEDASSLSSSSSTTSSNNALNSVNKTATNIKRHKTNNNNASTTTTTNSTTNVPPSQTQPQSQSQPSVPPHDPLDPQHVVDIIEMPLDTVDGKITSKDNDSLSSSAQISRKSEVVPEIRVMAPSLDPSLGGSGSLSKQWSHEKVDSAGDFNFDEDFTSRDHNIIIELLISTWFAILSNTDLICYIVVFINQVVNASIISLPLPLMVFLWGTLSLPRPTKTFWVTLIAYTQANVLIKCIFQFKLIWANYINLPNQPLSPAKIFGVELNPGYAKYDLILLLVLFLHRFILKSQGLWKSEYKDEIVQEVLIVKYDHSTEQRSSPSYEPSQEIITTSSERPKTPDVEDHSSQHQSPDSTETHDYLHGMSKLKRTEYSSSLRKFFFKMLNKTRLPSDVYALMFLCDFVNFFVLLFGFTAFGSQQSEGDGGVQTYLAENKVPIPFLIMLLVQFILIVIDRALYLRKALINKIIFHFFSVIGIHIWMFFVVPLVTERSFNSLSPPIIFYIIKCFYMLLSSYQIKCGYPKRILGNFLTKGFSLANMISFKVYMQIPFLYELRTILDWVCTDTTMTLFDWLKMEDIFSDIYFIKCSRQMETDFPAIRAQKKALYTKLMMGGTIILLIVISIWGPLCLFALGNAVGQSNVPYEVSTTIRIGPYDPIYDTNNRESIYTFKDSMYQSMKNTYLKDKSAMTFLTGYDASDIAAIGLAGNSPSLWSISPPDKQRLLTDFKNNVPLIARFSYSLTRIPPAKGLIGTVSSEVTFKLNETFPGREEMIKMLDGSGTTATVMLPALLPKFIKVLNSGDMTIVHAMMPKNEVYRPLLIRMQTSLYSEDVWWEIREYCDDSFHTNTLSKLPLSKCDSGIVMYTFNDKKFPSTFSFLTAGGIIGLYTTFVLLASRFLKSFIAGQNRKIMFEDLPYVDRVLQLCLDIYLVREALEFALEEDLFAKLIFLYRSPETMIKWTRPKEEVNDDETDTDSVPSRNSGRRQEQQ